MLSQACWHRGQLALYTDILERKGLGVARRAFVWDIHGNEVTYDFDEPQVASGANTLWDVYIDYRVQAEKIVNDGLNTTPAYSAACKLCHWYSHCTEHLKTAGDLTTIPELGRSKRDVLSGSFASVKDLAEADIQEFLSGKKTVFPGIGKDTLVKYQKRAKLLTTENATPFSESPILLPKFDRELFFDFEVDPMRDICYLHGFIERRNQDNATESFFYTFTDEVTLESERQAFASALDFISSCQPCGVFYYSKYERTIYRKLQRKYPDVCTPEAIESLFDPSSAIDLYNDVVKKGTEWPTWDYSIKSLAKYLGFTWRDKHPSGAASIEWFHRWIETGDADICKRILDYNEDDCRATRVLLDAIYELPIIGEL
jgi:predicted RecB family nuclease